MYVYTPDIGKGIYFFMPLRYFFKNGANPLISFKKLLVSSTVFLYVFRKRYTVGTYFQVFFELEIGLRIELPAHKLQQQASSILAGFDGL